MCRMASFFSKTKKSNARTQALIISSFILLLGLIRIITSERNPPSVPGGGAKCQDSTTVNHEATFQDKDTAEQFFKRMSKPAKWKLVIHETCMPLFSTVIFSMAALSLTYPEATVVDRACSIAFFIVLFILYGFKWCVVTYRDWDAGVKINGLLFVKVLFLAFFCLSFKYLEYFLSPAWVLAINLVGTMGITLATKTIFSLPSDWVEAAEK